MDFALSSATTPPRHLTVGHAASHMGRTTVHDDVPHSTTKYELFSDTSEPPLRAPPSACCASPSSSCYEASSTVALAVGIAMGAHASKESLVPSEPVMEALGITPFAYSCLTVAPTVLGMVSPLLWGAAWDRRSPHVFVAAPAGELLGAVLIATGLARLDSGSGAPAGDVGDEGVALAAQAGGHPDGVAILLLGVLAFSCCRAGVTIAAFSAVGALRGGSSTLLGFMALVLSKHALVALMSWVRRAIRRAIRRNSSQFCAQSH